MKNTTQKYRKYRIQPHCYNPNHAHQLADMHHLLARMEWAGRELYDDRTFLSICPSCGGINPDQAGAFLVNQSARGHRPTCELHSLLKEPY